MISCDKNGRSNSAKMTNGRKYDLNSIFLTVKS